tara:strand:- start:115 stop:558 length:444 start_codon:yes stop_codon:yes gene_type:complete
MLPITEEDAREDLRSTLLALCSEHGPTKVGKAIGADEKTVRNARDEKSTLRLDSAVNLLLMDGTALDPLLARFGRRSAAINSVTLDIAEIPCSVAEAVPLLIKLFHDGDASDDDIRTLDREGVIQRFVDLADMLVSRRETVRLKAVS